MPLRPGLVELLVGIYGDLVNSQSRAVMGIKARQCKAAVLIQVRSRRPATFGNKHYLAIPQRLAVNQHLASNSNSIGIAIAPNNGRQCHSKQTRGANDRYHGAY
jgi:hypothetical protein